jgi:sulfite exporter TauE/SafE
MCGSVTCTLDAACTPGTRARTHALFLVGRVSGYALVGLAAGGLGAALSSVAPSNAQWGVRVIVALLGVLVGLQTAGVWRVFSSAEPAVQRLFAKVSPRVKSLLRAPTASASLTLGLLWSLVPCGMVYAALALAASSGSAPTGALTMLAFGLGTAPALLALAWLSARLRGVQNARWVARARVVLGLSVALLSLVEGAKSLDRMGWFGPRHIFIEQNDHCATPVPPR